MMKLLRIIKNTIIFIFILVLTFILYLHSSTTEVNKRGILKYTKGSLNNVISYTNNIEIYPGLRMFAYSDNNYKNIKFYTNIDISSDKSIIIAYRNATSERIRILHTYYDKYCCALYSINGVKIKIINDNPNKIGSIYRHSFIIEPGEQIQTKIPSINELFNVNTNNEYIFKLALWLYDMNKNIYYLSQPIVLKINNKKY